MKVFISWSGGRSQALAQALHDWLPLVVHFVEPWVSHSDVDAGDRWANEVGKELQESNYGIICITRENASSPWILFEAGALAKSMDQARVIPLLLDIEFRDISGPLAQFQAKKVDRQGLLEIVTSVNKLDSHPVPDMRLRQLFESLWPNFEQKIETIPLPTGHAKHNRPQHEILEELVAGVRGLDLRFRESLEEALPLRRRRSRMHPMFLSEMSHLLELRRGDPMRMLLFASYFRDELPWLYELALDAYRAGPPSSAKARQAHRRFLDAMRLLQRGPFLREFSRDKEMHMLMGEMEHLLLEDFGRQGPLDDPEHGEEEVDSDGGK
jgi:TIR domain